jgi:putative DNA primase/helicase
MDEKEQAKKIEFLDRILDYDGNEYLDELCLDEKYRPDIGKILARLFSIYSFKTSEDTETVYYFDTGIYREAETFIKNKIEEIFQEKATTHMVIEIINHIKRATYVPREEFNKNKNYLPVKNGLINLETFEIEPFDPEKIFTFKIDVEYDPTADCPLFKKTISEVVDEEDIPVLQEFFGYCLYPAMPTHKSFWLYGGGRNGKTTIVNILKYLLGDENYASVPLDQLYGDNRFSKANLYGKMANIIPEPNSKREMETTEFKMLTGGDTVDAEVKNKQKPIRFVNFAKFIIHGNRFPTVKDNTTAFWERMLVIKFPNTFLDESPATVKDLDKKIFEAGELPGILNWCIDGLRRLMNNNFRFTLSKGIEDIKLEFMKMSNSAMAFVDEACTLKPDLWIVIADLYNHYKDWCEENGVDSVSKDKFSKTLGDIPRVKLDRKRVDGILKRVAIGINIKDDNSDDKEDLDNWIS